MTPTSDRFQELEACHGRLLSWCDLLEAVADFLPCRVDERFCEAVGRELLPLIDTTQLIEEQAICVALSVIMTDAERADAEERRRAARISRSGVAREVVDALTRPEGGSLHAFLGCAQLHHPFVHRRNARPYQGEAGDRREDSQRPRANDRGFGQAGFGGGLTIAENSCLPTDQRPSISSRAFNASSRAV
jgi:hypothetical protein